MRSPLLSIDSGEVGEGRDEWSFRSLGFYQLGFAGALSVQYEELKIRRCGATKCSRSSMEKGIGGRGRGPDVFQYIL